ncbi:hypothetical protein J6590_036125 [Homalodisca vitripennis]|nr:hypothetical protein J6590_036125 [Homalodisca vitripennis]
MAKGQALTFCKRERSDPDIAALRVAVRVRASYSHPASSRLSSPQALPILSAKNAGHVSLRQSQLITSVSLTIPRQCPFAESVFCFSQVFVLLENVKQVA